MRPGGSHRIVTHLHITYALSHRRRQTGMHTRSNQRGISVSGALKHSRSHTVLIPRLRTQTHHKQTHTHATHAGTKPEITEQTHSAIASKKIFKIRRGGEQLTRKHYNQQHNKTKDGWRTETGWLAWKTIPEEFCYCGHLPLLVWVQGEGDMWTQVSAWPLAEPKASVWRHMTRWEIQIRRNSTRVIHLQSPVWYWALNQTA